ncbi:glycosyl transferase family 2 [Shimia isoporae]|uniref:Glycosyl transferase family 2 n=1 Tax=Shimia isoporae TaxID=647720 RepID=A0A4R1N9V7_9RHOB|nr:glycosyltransferase family 2 protein [Shimia isoporae]TCK99924.1 glycosyl transferase family 2 [Shimia isoporae]
MTQPPVSVVVVSKGRPRSLRRTLTAVSQQAYPEFEIIVVTDDDGVDAVGFLEFGHQIKLVSFDEDNISTARNQGIAAAAGEIVAFIDDDAVPETGWLWHLTAPFSEAEVAAAGGYVRGRNGITFQWRARSVNSAAEYDDIAISGDKPVVMTPAKGRAIKTEGTNMAFRRDVIAEMGGFDPAFEFYLDETDVNMRLADQGAATAIVPLAEVHHGFFESARRTARRAPRDLAQNGASMAVFLRKHCREADRADVWSAYQRGQRKRLVDYMIKGELMPGDVARLMRGLRKGYAEGLERKITVLERIPRASDGFRAFERQVAGAEIIAGRQWRRAAIRREALASSRAGRIPSVFVFSRTGLFHRVTFHSEGYWEQVGGLFGRSDRAQRLFRITGFRKRLRQEQQRVARQRLLLDESETSAREGKA